MIWWLFFITTYQISYEDLSFSLNLAIIYTLKTCDDSWHINRLSVFLTNFQCKHKGKFTLNVNIFIWILSKKKDTNKTKTRRSLEGALARRLKKPPLWIPVYIFVVWHQLKKMIWLSYYNVSGQKDLIFSTWDI